MFAASTFAPVLVSAYWLLVLIAFVLTLISGTTGGKMPIWVPVLLVTIAMMIAAAPR